MSAVTTILQALKTTDVLTRKDVGELLDAECLPSAIDSTLATMCRRGLIEKLADADAFVLPSPGEREVTKPTPAHTPAPAPVPNLGGRPATPPSGHAPNRDMTGTLPSRIREVLGRCGELAGAQIVELLPGANAPSVFAMLTKMRLRGELTKTGRLFTLAPGYKPSVSPWRQPRPAVEAAPVAQPEPAPVGAVAAPEPEPVEVPPAPSVAAASARIADLAAKHSADALPYSTTIELPGLRLRVEAAVSDYLLAAVDGAVHAYCQKAVI